MSGGPVSDGSTYTQERATEAAAAPAAPSAVDTSGSIARVQALVLGGAPPAEVAAVVRQAPGERVGIITMLQRTVGNGYVQQVLAEVSRGDGGTRIDDATKPAFLSELRGAIEQAIDGVVGAGSTEDCPYLDKYFARYAEAPVATLEAVIDRWVPNAASAKTPSQLIPMIVTRVVDAARTWQQTRQLPPDLLAADPGAVEPPPTAGAIDSSGAPMTLGAMEHQLGSGQPIDSATAQRMSSTIGADVSEARIHSGSTAAAMASANNAAAFAVGNNVVLGRNVPAPGTVAGDALLAHELAHTAQQKDAANDPAGRNKPIAAESAVAEGDAGVERLSRMSAFASAMGDVMTTGLQLQRCPEDAASKGPPMSGGQADRLINSTAEIGDYISDDLRNGIDGAHAVHFHDDMDSYVKAWHDDSLAVTTVWAPDKTPQELDAMRWEAARDLAKSPGFTNYQTHQIHIYTKGTPAFVTIHEVVHLHTPASIYSEMGEHFVEGAADYYAEKVCQKNGLPFRASYKREAEVVQTLAENIGNESLGSLVFGGSVESARAILETKGAGTWKRFLAAIKAGEYSNAKDALEGVGAASAAHDQQVANAEHEKEEVENARRRQHDAEERKAWPDEATTAKHGRVIRKNVVSGNMHFTVGIGGKDGIHEGWTVVVHKPGHADVTASVLSVTTRTSDFMLPGQDHEDVDAVELRPRAKP